MTGEETHTYSGEKRPELKLEGNDPQLTVSGWVKMRDNQTCGGLAGVVYYQKASCPVILDINVRWELWEDDRGSTAAGIMDAIVGYSLWTSLCM